MIELIKKSSLPELEEIAKETRDIIIDVVSRNGGHLAPSLGTVDLTVALLKIFNPPEDKIIWDVGHQAYAYKILTDRKDRFGTLRKLNGISGFPKRGESIYDEFGVGHGGTSISAAIGIEEALTKRGDSSRVIAVIGDGAMTSGLAFEAMNQNAVKNKNLITILNDNEMSISKSVGALSSWFSRKMTGHAYSSVKNEVKTLLGKLPPVFRGERIIDVIRKALESSKSLLTPGMLFEGFGFQYVGPIDGNNIKELIDILNAIKFTEGPVLLHVLTKKGSGYAPAEDNPRQFHGVGPFNKIDGSFLHPSSPSFTDYLKQYLPPLFKRNPKLIGITAAMLDGTGLSKLQEMMPDRVYDVGMAEGHAVTFAAGLAAGGLRPVVAIYSTFLQRAFDMIIHDVALQKLPVLFLVDRAGIVGEDGPTHHGIFDISYLRMIPNMVLMSPRDEMEMARMIELAITLDGPSVIRYPRGSGAGKRFYNRVSAIKIGEGEFLKTNNSDTLMVTVGTTDRYAVDAYARLRENGFTSSIYDLKFIKPLPEELFSWVNEKKITKMVVIEENVIAGGAGSAILEELSRRNMFDVKVKLVGIKDHFPAHGTQKEIRDREMINGEALFSAVKSM